MFYKYENEQLIYGLYVTFPDSSMLHIDITDLSTLPIDGWYYFDTELEAKEFFNIKDES
jgi:hypothetical protein